MNSTSHSQFQNEITDRISSAQLQNERSIWIRPPRDVSSVENLTIFLDGEFYREGIGAAAVLEDLGGDIADTWVVFVSHHSPEARWIECPCHPPFAEFVVNELLPWLEARFDMKSVRYKTLVGLSYTGLAATYIALNKPGVFNRTISQSGSFWWNDCWLPKQCPSIPSQTKFYLDVGTAETKENIRHREDVLQRVSQIEGVDRMKNALVDSGQTVKFVKFDGRHEFKAWRSSLPGALQWALPLKKPRG